MVTLPVEKAIPFVRDLLNCTSMGENVCEEYVPDEAMCFEPSTKASMLPENLEVISTVMESTLS
jgi:hypothetical protein